MTTNQINYQNAMERIRNDREIEVETRRHNKAIEDYNKGYLSNQEFQSREVKRHNTVMETLQNRANEINALQAAIQDRYNMLNIELGNRRAAEEERHNQRNELLSSYSQELTRWLNEKNVELANRRLNYEHQENLIHLTTERKSQEATQAHYEYSDWTQRLNVIGNIGIKGATMLVQGVSLLGAGA